MRRFVFLLVGLVLAGAVAVAILDSGKPPPPEHGGVTSDRVPLHRMAEMVAGPMNLVLRKDMPGASRRFESELAAARGKGGLAAADLLSAFGVRLRLTGHHAEAVPYLRRAVDAYRVAAPGSADLALALSRYADVLLQQHPDDPPPETPTLLREALQLRLAKLGRNNAETAVSYVRLGAVEGLPVFSGRDPARVAAAAEKVRTGLRLLTEAPNAQAADLTDVRLQVALLYARNGEAEHAFKAAGEVMADNPRLGPHQLRRVAEAFEKAGDAANGRRLRDTYGIPDEPRKGWPTPVAVWDQPSAPGKIGKRSMAGAMSQLNAAPSDGSGSPTPQ